MLPSYKTSITSLSNAFIDYPWHDKMAYAEYLAQTYYYVCHSTRLLAASASRFSQEDQNLHKRFINHISEENSHELLALRDLQKLGYNINDFSELPQTKTLYEIQYYKIEHCDPAALMGYIVALEALAAGSEIKRIKEKVTALYGKDCAKFIQVHADNDPDHIEKAMKVVEDLKTNRLPEINSNIEQTVICFIDMLNACKAKAIGRNIKKAA